MKADEALKITLEARKTFDYEHRTFMERVQHYAGRGKTFMSMPKDTTNELRQRLIEDGYIVTPETIYWSTKD